MSKRLISVEVWPIPEWGANYVRIGLSSRDEERCRAGEVDRVTLLRSGARKWRKVATLLRQGKYVSGYDHKSCALCAVYRTDHCMRPQDNELDSSVNLRRITDDHWRVLPEHQDEICPVAYHTGYVQCKAAGWVEASRALIAHTSMGTKATRETAVAKAVRFAELLDELADKEEAR